MKFLTTQMHKLANAYKSRLTEYRRKSQTVQREKIKQELITNLLKFTDEFEIIDEKTEQPINKDNLQAYSNEELIKLFEEVLMGCEKIV